MFDDSLLDKFCRTFYGFGNYNGRYWFIGMEEAGGESETAVANRLAQWQTQGMPETEDLVVHATGLGWAGNYFGKRPKNQPTWNKLIRIILSAEGNNPVTLNKVKQFQRTALGRQESDNCLLELFPLPSPSTNKWIYAEYSNLPYLSDRKAYRSHLAELRVAYLRHKIEEYRPKMVVFYGWRYKDWWRKVANVSFEQNDEEKFLVGKNSDTTFFITKHPTAQGVTMDYFHHVGQIMMER
ncbi:hypothetical protein MNBD_CHLOROFLEXI01-4505 [hydrothermal vent metagenome]|uniref:Uncharacterized protein n=1 Tax=hydrothermal vent metagenome TaxID=652676 RepID=A0A3B0UU77_9ZZZZ